MDDTEGSEFGGLHQSLQDGSITCKEEIRHYARKARAANTALNAIVLERYEQALEEARAADVSVANGALPTEETAHWP